MNPWLWVLVVVVVWLAIPLLIAQVFGARTEFESRPVDELEQWRRRRHPAGRRRDAS